MPSTGIPSASIQVQKILKFILLEPMGSAAPKVNLKLKAIETSVNEKLALVCPAQGMPLPAFR